MIGAPLPGVRGFRRLRSRILLAFALLAVWGAHVWLGAAAALLAAGHFVNSWHTYTLIKSKLF